MKHRHLLIGLVVLGGLFGSSCSDSSEPASIPPATVEELGEDLWRIELTARAAERTGVETVDVSMQQIDGVDRLVVPYSALIYHFEGSTWTYTSPQDLVYVREPVDIDFIVGDLAVLNDGPAVGTMVVSVGAAELYGVEFGIGK